MPFQNKQSITNSKQTVLDMSENVEDKPNHQRTLQPSLQQKRSLRASSISLQVGDRDRGDRELSESISISKTELSFQQAQQKPNRSSSSSSSSVASTPPFEDEDEEVRRSVFTSAFAEFFATFLFLFFICFGPSIQAKPDDFEVSFIIALSRGKLVNLSRLYNPSSVVRC